MDCLLGAEITFKYQTQILFANSDTVIFDNQFRSVFARLYRYRYFTAVGSIFDRIPNQAGNNFLQPCLGYPRPPSLYSSEDQVSEVRWFCSQTGQGSPEYSHRF